MLPTPMLTRSNRLTGGTEKSEESSQHGAEGISSPSEAEKTSEKKNPILKEKTENMIELGFVHVRCVQRSILNLGLTPLS